MEHRSRVLVVDDDDAFRGAVVRMLASTFDVTTAKDGEDAVMKISADAGFDLVVMDLEMPRMNGRAAYERIAEVAPPVARRTLIMSGGSGVLELQEWLNGLGPTRLLLKPFSSRRLVEAIDDLFTELARTGSA